MSQTNAQPPALEIPLLVESPVPVHEGTIPLSVGVPLPKGRLFEPFALELGTGALVQSSTLARWPDGSVRWAQADVLLPDLPEGRSELRFHARGGDRPSRSQSPRVEEVDGRLARLAGEELAVEVGAAEGGIVRLAPGGDASPLALRLVLRHGGRRLEPRVETARGVASGPVRAEATCEGRLAGTLRFRLRLSYWPSASLVRVRLTLHNPRRARHRGGLWDLGDPGSFLFDALDLELVADRLRSVSHRLDPDSPWRRSELPVHLYQDSSGGERWNSRSHVNARGEVPCRLRGYELQEGGRRATGLRASPTARFEAGGAHWTSTVPEFWQKFPKGLRIGDTGVTWELFPDSWNDRFELQGGERTTHDLWLTLGEDAAAGEETLSWVHRPPGVAPEPEWVRRCRVLPWLDLDGEHWDTRLEELLASKLVGERSFEALREEVDEYGWRNYGELWADHEQRYYEGSERPVISHYNNQYDVLFGFLVQLLRTGDARWLDLAHPLARHVMDIDLYHADDDRPAYSGGYFWHTDHYRTAATATHRGYSLANAEPGRPYGGGPSNEHNYTTGLLLFHYLTGDPDAAEAVRGLASWVERMDEGRWPWAGRRWPTGLASKTFSMDFHGPGRGAANSVNALLDRWLLDGDRAELERAEGLIRRCIHPHDEPSEMNLLDIEGRWSYTVFLGVLARYLELKVESGDLDDMYSYARSGLLRYARWMAESERPFFDREEELEFPTETWAAQELRKATVLFAAARLEESERAAGLRQAAGRFSERAWSDLWRFESRDFTRPVAILMTEGVKDSWYRRGDPAPLPQAEIEPARAPRGEFLPLRERLRRWLRRGA